MGRRILLTTVFKPFAVDDMYSRKENVAEVFIATVQRNQEMFNVRQWHVNSGLHLIAANCGIDATVLEWPSLEELEGELRTGHYDYVGISFITPTTQKMRRMVELIREASPGSKIVLGGHGVLTPGLESLVGADYICRGEGIAYARELFGKGQARGIRHPVMTSEIVRWMEMTLMPPRKVGQIVTGVGCRNACEFCITSHFFNARYHPFIEGGQEIYQLVQEQAEKENLSNFYLMDENFLQDKGRADAFWRAAVEDNDRARYFIFNILFSSAENVAMYDPRQLAEMGVGTLWIGYESKYASYKKNRDVDIPALVESLKEYGISVLLSFIMFLDLHDEEKLEEDITSFLGCGQAYSQFAPAMAIPGTALHGEMARDGRIIETVPYEERHGLGSIWHKHPKFPVYKTRQMLNDAFEREYEELGPGIIRNYQNELQGYRKYVGSRSPVLRKRALQLREWLELGVSWVLAAEQLARESHRGRIREVILEAEDVLGKIPIPVRDKAKRLAELSRRLRGRGPMEPETRRTVYAQRG